MNPGSFCGSCGAAVKPRALYCGSCGSPAAQAPAAAPSPAPPTMIGTVGGGSVPPLPPQAETWPPPPPAAGAGSFGPVGFVGYATFGRRVGAYILDAVPYLI